MNLRLIFILLGLAPQLLMAKPADTQSAGFASADAPVVIALRKEPITLRSTTFSVVRVVDDRKNETGLGVILSGPKATAPIRLNERAADGLHELLRAGFRSDSTRVPVTIRVREFAFSEKEKSELQAEGSCRLELAFEVLREQKPILLTTYTAKTHYVRSFSQTDRLEYVARKALESGMQYLSDWIKLNRDKSPALVKGLQFVFKDYAVQQAAGDTVFHSVYRPLIWDDFLAQQRPGSRNGAAIYPSFSYEGSSRWVNGYMEVQLTFKVFMLKSMSWVTPGVQNEYGLKHEQLHFDIVKLIAERFKHRIAVDDDMDLDDYNSRIQFLYLDAYREMNRWQEQYDRETQHGINQLEQARWNRKVADELAKAEAMTDIIVSNRK